MQRSSTSYRPLDSYVIDVRQQQQQLQGRQSPTKRMDDIGELPIYDPRTTAGRRSRPWPEKWIHVIPVIILLVFFVLWWCSYPGISLLKLSRFFRLSIILSVWLLRKSVVFLFIFLSLSSFPRKIKSVCGIIWSGNQEEINVRSQFICSILICSVS